MHAVSQAIATAQLSSNFDQDPNHCNAKRMVLASSLPQCFQDAACPTQRMANQHMLETGQDAFIIFEALQR